MPRGKKQVKNQTQSNTLLDYFSKIPPTPGQHVESDLVATTGAEACTCIVESNAHCQTTPVHVENTTEGAHLMKSNAIANHHHNSSRNTSSESDTVEDDDKCTTARADALESNAIPKPHRIDSGYTSTAEESSMAANAISTVQQYYKDLEEINPDDIIGRLYSKKVISKTERDMAQAPTRLDFERMHIILKAVEGVPDKFPLFLASLGEIPKYERLAEKMQKSYSTGNTTSLNRSINASVNEYAERLRSYYRNNKYSENDDWAWCQVPDIYIDLWMIEKRSPHSSNLDRIDSKRPLLPALKADGTNLHKLVLIEGEAGIGKSTWCWNICKEWAKHKSFNQIQLLIRLPLCRLRTCKVTDSKDLWKFYLGHSEEEIDELDKTAHDTHGRGILFLFDGYEKYSGASGLNQEIVHKIIDGHCLPEANVIVTTRSSRSIKWKNRVGQHIEILGFSKENAVAYMKILDANKSTPVMNDVEHLMTSPLNCNILAHVRCSPYHLNDAPLTMTQIYTYFIRSLIASQFPEKEEQFVKCESLDDLPDDIMEQLKKLSSLAYDRMSGHKYWFDKLPDNCEPMGLMNLCEDCSNGPTRARTVTYYFKALIQEYLAAFHMLHLDQCDELEHQQRYGFSLVMQFLCGLQGTCELGNYPSSDDDHEKSDDDSEENGQFIIQEAGYSTNNVESDDEDDVNEDGNCGNSFLCEQEGIDDENITEKDSGYNDQKTNAANKDDLDHTFVNEDEEGGSKIMRHILNVNTKGEEIASPVLNNSNHEIVDDTIYYLSQKRERDSDDEDAFLRGLKKRSKRPLDSDTECSEEQEPLEGCREDQEPLETSMSGNNNDSSVQITSQCEETNLMTDDDVIIKKQTLLCMFEAQNMQGIPGLSVIYEETKACLTPSDSFKLGYCISQSKAKWTLHLSSACINDETLEAFAEGVHKGNNKGKIVELNLDGNHFEQFETLCCVPVKILSLCKEISLVNCFLNPPKDATLADYLSSIKALTSIDLSNNNLTDDKAEHLITSLISCKKLKSLKLKKTNLGVKSQYAISKLLSNAKTIRHLDISGNQFPSGGGMEQLCLGIMKSTSLQVLDISECIISLQAKAYFSTNVKPHSNLKIIREWQ